MDSSTTSAPRSIWAILVDVFVAPVKAFEDYKKNPNLWVPLVLMIVLAVLAAGITLKQNSAAQYDLMSGATNIPPAALAQMQADAQNPSPTGALIGAAVVVPIISAIGALIAWLFGSFIFGQKAKYTHVWGAGMAAGIVPMVGGLIRAGFVVAKDSIYVSFGPAALMSGADFTSILYSILYFSDVFAIWGVIVAGFAYSAIFGLSRCKGMAISIIIWLLGVALFVGGQQIGFAFAGVETSFM